MKTLICDFSFVNPQLGPLVPAPWKMSMSYWGQEDRDVCFVIVALMTFLSFLGTLQHNSRWNLWSTKYFFLLPLHLCIPLNCDLVIPRCKSWCCSEITLEGRKLSVLPLIWFTGNCRSWKYLRDYPVYLLIFLDEKTVQGLSNMFRVTQCLIRVKNLFLISNPVLFS